MKRLLCSCCICWLASATLLFPQEPFRVMFYNVENLFDTQNDSLKEDEQFLPEGFMHWRPYKYWEKLRNLTRVITAVGEMHSPALIGLCEVENDSVLFDLTKRSPLRAQGYEYLVTDSPDERGIDVALLYQPHQFRLLERCEYEINFRQRDRRPTRNILHVAGEVINGKIIDLFICHFPSRSEGREVSEPARIDAAALLRRKCDSIFNSRESAHILIMGDFNDNPEEKSLSQVLAAKRSDGSPQHDELYNLFYSFDSKGEKGTYKYQGRWEIFDQFIVSGNLLTGDGGITVKKNSAEIFSAPFLLEEDKRYYGMKPFRTSQGPRYLGGFSDHLPIRMDLIIHLQE
ncbi:MAG: pulmonis MnuA nuclease-like [Proteiniphilum sp.]|nr:pulmonis MnuA nuclease-like [Proteiniphilum sp.]